MIDKLSKLNDKIDKFLLKFVNLIVSDFKCQKKLFECSKIQNGYAFKPTQYLDNLNEHSLEVLKMGHININGGLKIEPKKDYVENDKKFSKWILNKYDIVLGMTDMKDKVIILGVPALIDESNKYVLNQRVARISIDSNIVHPLLVYYQMRDQVFIDELRKYANSGVQVNLTTDSIKNMEIKIPDNLINNYLNNKIENIYNIYENNRKKIRLLKECKNKLLKKFFG